MFIHVTSAQYIKDYKIWLSFSDGAQGEIDLSSELFGELFEPLKEIKFFKSFELEDHTISWNNGADFAPEFLREQIMTDTK